MRRTRFGGNYKGFHEISWYCAAFPTGREATPGFRVSRWIYKSQRSELPAQSLVRRILWLQLWIRGFRPTGHLSHNLNSLTGLYKGLYRGLLQGLWTMAHLKESFKQDIPTFYRASVLWCYQEMNYKCNGDLSVYKFVPQYSYPKPPES